MYKNCYNIFIKINKNFKRGLYMKETYDKLNYYLNAICNYLEKEHPFLLENIDKICRINDAFLRFLKSYSLKLFKII